MTQRLWPTHGTDPTPQSADQLRRTVRGLGSHPLQQLMIDPSLPRVSMTELRRHFGRIIGEVEQGQTFVITRRGHEVAVLVPPEHYSRAG